MRASKNYVSFLDVIVVKALVLDPCKPAGFPYVFRLHLGRYVRTRCLWVILQSIPSVKT